MKRVLSLFLVVALMVSGTTAFASERRASYYFDSYALVIGPLGGQEMGVSFGVFGTGKMDVIGVYSLRIEEEVSDNVWITSFTVYGEDDPETFFSEDAYEHVGSFTFTGLPDVKYRAVLVGYAEDESGYEYSREVTCVGKVCE